MNSSLNIESCDAMRCNAILRASLCIAQVVARDLHKISFGDSDIDLWAVRLVSFVSLGAHFAHRQCARCGVLNSGVFCCVYSGQVEQLVERGQTRAIGGRSLLPFFFTFGHECTDYCRARRIRIRLRVRVCVRACMHASLSERACMRVCLFRGLVGKPFRMKYDEWRVCTDRARLQMHWSWPRTR